MTGDGSALKGAAFVVVGGGIAGVCCAEELCRICPGCTVTLISASVQLKGVETVSHVTQNVEELKVVERPLSSLPSLWSNLTVHCAAVVDYDLDQKVLTLSDGRTVQFDKLCLATGGRPKVIWQHPSVLTIRDTDTVEELRRRLSNARRVMVIGNGGIAMETVHALQGVVEVVWVAKHSQIGDAFFDRDAGEFLLDELRQRQQEQQEQLGHQDPELLPEPAPSCCSREPERSAAAAASSGSRECEDPIGEAPTDDGQRTNPMGHAAGPRWMDDLLLLRSSSSSNRRATDSEGATVTVEHCEVAHISDASRGNGREDEDHGSDAGPHHPPVAVTLTNGKVYVVDLVISAVGVEPNTDGMPERLRRADDGGLEVDARLQTSCGGVFAAGDVCTVQRDAAASPQWFQMRLWTQARLMGSYSAHCMAGAADELCSGFNFELFTHCTRFFGMKVVLLGLYNAQTLDDEPEKDIVTYQRRLEHADGSRSFARLLLLRGRMQGAVLVGETELEETCENLILSGLDLTDIGPQLLDPEMEVDHIFD